MVVNFNDEEIRLPDFLLVGAAKSGTTSMYYLLNQHPQVFMSQVKEPQFFCFFKKKTPLVNPISGKILAEIKYDLKDYLNLYKGADAFQKIGEASAMYLYFYDDTIRNLKEIYGEDYKKIKILMILRNPLERAWSAYMMEKRGGAEKLGFEKAVSEDIIGKRLSLNWPPGWDYIGFGKYYEQVKAYLEAFDNVHVVLYDDFNSDTGKILKEIYNFLDIDGEFLPDTSKRYNVSGKPKNKYASAMVKFIYQPNFIKDKLGTLISDKLRLKLRDEMRVRFEFLLMKEKMTESQKKQLKDIYSDDIKKLSRLLGRDLVGWLE